MHNDYEAFLSSSYIRQSTKAWQSLVLDTWIPKARVFVLLMLVRYRCSDTKARIGLNRQATRKLINSSSHLFLSKFSCFKMLSNMDFRGLNNNCLKQTKSTQMEFLQSNDRTSPERTAKADHGLHVSLG